MTLSITTIRTAALQRQSRVSYLHRGKLERKWYKKQEETRELGTFVGIMMKGGVFCHIASRSAAFLLANKDTHSHATPSL